MKQKKKKLQIFLLSIGFLLILVTYFYYPYMKRVEFEKIQSVEKKFPEKSEQDLDVSFENVEYVGFNPEAPFTVKAKNAHQKKGNDEIVFMDTMHLVMHLKNGQIDIYSDTGSFNKITNDVIMENSVRVVETPGTTIIYAEDLHLFASSNEAKIFNKVNVTNDSGSYLKAHSIKYDFLRRKLKVEALENQLVKMKILDDK